MNDSPPGISTPSDYSSAMSPATGRSQLDTTKTLSRRERGFKRSSMAQLTLVRFREFIREPEAVFWTFIFPILLAAGLGIAFRQRGPDKLPVGVVNSANSSALIRSLTNDSTLVVQSFSASAGAKALRTGKISLLVVPGSRTDSVGYIYDKSR